MLAAATLLFLIALPMVNCRRRNTFRIEQLDEDLRVKGYDHGERANKVNKAMNACSIKANHKNYEKCLYSEEDVCKILSRVAVKFNREKEKICNLSMGIGGDCVCDLPDDQCAECIIEKSRL